MEEGSSSNQRFKRFIRKIILLCVGIGFVVVGWVTKDQIVLYFDKTFHQPIPILKKPEDWITVFVHGTFSCHFGLLSLSAVFNDSIGKTLYKKIVESKRKDPSNFIDQAMLQRGLIKIQPSYDLHVTNGQHFSAYPLAQVFQDFTHHISQKQIHTTFYTFGWSGLLSQKQRRIESVRFYNALTAEIEHYHLLGKHPKIRLVAHSHGGNLCLNLAAINDILSLPSYDNVSTTTADAATNETLAAMFNYLKKLPNKESVANAKKFKSFDHVPTAHLTINELVLFGTPVQIETEPLYFSPTFKKIYHFYSEEDSVQPFDFVSTKKQSSRRIKRTTAQLPKILAFPQLIQGKIVVNRHRRHHRKENSKKYALSHKDLWAISWHPGNNPLAPLPIFVFTPLLLAALDAQTVACHDVDVNIRITRKYLKIQVAPRDRQELNTLVALPRNTLEEIRCNLKRWDPYHAIRG